MKKIISGKKYDTETATGVAEYDTGNRSSFSWYSEELYRKRTGEFFLFGRGHAASKYARKCADGGWDPGEDITPLSYQAAQKWAEEHLDVDQYEAIFGEVEDDDSKTQLSVSISAAAAERAKRAAAQAGMSVSAYVESLL